MDSQDPGGPDRPRAFAYLSAEVSGGDHVRWWYPALWYVPVLAVALAVALVGPFHGGWRLLASLVAGALTYLAIFVVFLVAVSAVGGVKAYRSNRLFKKDPHTHYEKITGQPWPPPPGPPSGPSQPLE